ncbi:MAG: Yip1 family protein [Bacteroidales bacterium]|jgi:hypothetical protein|nr:Yip1 family protein [Bacteroidales bacterium]
MTEEKFDFKKFIDDSKQALLNPKEYFTSLTSDEGIGVLVIKALIYGAVAGVFAFLWNVFNITGIGMFGGAIAILAFVWTIVAAVIGLFLGGVIILIISSICTGKDDFEANLRVSAVLLVLMPINAFLAVFGGLSNFLGAIIGLAVNLWAVWMIYNALIYNLKAKPETSKVIAYVLAGVFALFMIIGLVTRSRAPRYLGLNNREARNIVKEYGKSANKLMKEAEKMSKEVENAAKDISKDYEEAAEEMEKYTKGSEESVFAIEMANGNTFEDIDKSKIKDALKDLDEDNDFMILSEGDNFIQTAVSEKIYIVEYKDKTGYFKSVSNDIDYGDVKDMFIGFYKGENKWKELTKWELAE